MNPAAGRRLAALREDARRALDGWDDDAARARHHPELSPLAWHLGHVFFVETYWLREVVGSDDSATAPWHALYFPEFCAKNARAVRLPACAELLAWTRELEAGNEDFWAVADGDHRLMRNGYLPAFLAQHYAQHLETMTMVRRQRALRVHDEPGDAAPLTEPAPPSTEAVDVPGGEVRVGAEEIAAYDNERPAYTVRVENFRLARRPVNNAQWLAFMADSGYRRPELWTDAGRRWLAASGASHPQHWRPHPGGGWYCPDPHDPLQPELPVHGICAHEADAFARWAGARLPHEHEWERAARLGLAENTGTVWEWCANALFPYPGFTAFPYDGYSTPWFDGGHRVLRGASRHTRPEIRRPSFRNFYPQGHRHVFAGLRLVPAAATQFMA